MVVGTGNKVEDFGVGFYTKYGDGGVDISPIADLLKSEVVKLGIYLEISELIIKAKPSDGLYADSRSDEDQLGAGYDELEWAMRVEDHNIKTENISLDPSRLIKLKINIKWCQFQSVKFLIIY